MARSTKAFLAAVCFSITTVTSMAGTLVRKQHRSSDIKREILLANGQLESDTGGAVEETIVEEIEEQSPVAENIAVMDEGTVAFRLQYPMKSDGGSLLQPEEALELSDKFMLSAGTQQFCYQQKEASVAEDKVDDEEVLHFTNTSSKSGKEIQIAPMGGSTPPGSYCCGGILPDEVARTTCQQVSDELIQLPDKLIYAKVHSKSSSEELKVAVAQLVNLAKHSTVSSLIALPVQVYDDVFSSLEGHPGQKKLLKTDGTATYVIVRRTIIRTIHRTITHSKGCHRR